MKRQPTAYAILKVLKSKKYGLTAKHIAELGNIDMTSENIQYISDQCFDFIDSGICFGTDLRKAPVNAGLFFSMAT